MRKLYVFEGNYETKKEMIFEFLRENSDVERPSRIYKIFPDIPKSTIRQYLREWRILNRNELMLYINDIKTVLEILSFKYTLSKQLSMEESKSLERVGDLVDRFGSDNHE